MNKPKKKAANCHEYNAIKALDDILDLQYKKELIKCPYCDKQHLR